MGSLGEELAVRVGVKEFFSLMGVALDGGGEQLKGLCPFHDDHNPSFSVHSSFGLWKCYAGCGDGDMVDFFAKTRGLPTEGKEEFRAVAAAIEKEFFNGHRPPAPVVAAQERPPEKPKEIPEALLLEYEKKALEFLEAWPAVEGYPPEYRVHLYAKDTPQEGFLLPVYHIKSGHVVSVKTRFLKPQPPRGDKPPLKSLNMAAWCLECNARSQKACFKAHSSRVLRFPGGLLGLPILQKHTEAVVLLCEGEKDMLAAARRLPLERYAPCSFSTGAAGFPEGAGEFLAKRRVLLCYDADRAGRLGMTDKEVKLAEHGGTFARIDLVESPGDLIKGTPESKDLFDYFGAGGTPEALVAWFDEVRYEGGSGKPPDGAAPPSDGEGDWGFPSGAEDRPNIEDTVQVHTVVIEMEGILVDKKVGLYSRMGKLCRIVREERKREQQEEEKAAGEPVRDIGAPVIRVMTLPALRMLVSKHMQFQRYDGKKKRCVPIRPPTDPASMLLDMGAWRFPPLEGFATAPFLRADGSICERPGYDEATGMILEPDNEFEAIPEKPTRGDAVKALNILYKPFEQFPFNEDKHMAATMAAMLTLAAREAIRGPCPMFTVSAPTPGSGKTLLVWMVVSAVTGKKPASTDWVRDEDEFRKTVLSMGLAGDRAVLLDNVEGQVGSALLSNVLTSDEFRGRLLGVNEMVSTELKMVWFATGNNLMTRSDGFRRTVPIMIDPHMEFPTHRHFKGDHSDPMGFVRKLRRTMIPAILTVLRAYHLAGHPKPVDHVPTGSFESWDDWVRCSLIWAMGIDCRGGADEGSSATETDVDLMGNVFREWDKVFGDQPQTVRAIIETAKAPLMQGLLDALCALNHKGEDRPIPMVIAKALSRFKGRIINGLHLDIHDKDRNKVTYWAVKKVS